MANIAAIDTVNSYIVYVAQDDEHNIYGYWISPEGYTLAEAPIVRFDTEGQYSLLSGRNLTEALLGAVKEDDDELFTEMRSALEAYGISTAATSGMN